MADPQQLPENSVGTNLKLYNSLDVKDITLGGALNFSDGTSLSSLPTGGSTQIQRYTGLTPVIAVTPAASIQVQYSSYKQSTNTTVTGQSIINTTAGTYTTLLSYLQSLFNVPSVMQVTAASQNAQGVISCSGTVTQNGSLITINSPKKITVTDNAIISILGMSSSTQTIVSDRPIQVTTNWSVTFPFSSSVNFTGLGAQNVTAVTNCTVAGRVNPVPVVDGLTNLTTYEGTVNVTPLAAGTTCSFYVTLNTVGAVSKPYYWAEARGQWSGGSIATISVSEPTSSATTTLGFTVNFFPSNTAVHRIRFIGIF